MKKGEYANAKATPIMWDNHYALVVMHETEQKTERYDLLERHGKELKKIAVYGGHEKPENEMPEGQKHCIEETLNFNAYQEAVMEYERVGGVWNGPPRWP